MTVQAILDKSYSRLLLTTNAILIVIQFAFYWISNAVIGEYQAPRL